MALVKFQVTLKSGVDVEDVKKGLEALASDLNLETLDVGSLKNRYLFGATEQATYEKLFKIKLVCVTKQIGSVEYNHWHGLGSKVPESLKDKIDSISLQEKMYPNKMV